MHDFVALDVETANSNRHSICSIGMVRFKEGQMLESYYELINPDESFSQANSAIHGIQEHEVLFSPRFYDVTKDMMDFIGGRPVVAHNATFDMGALRDNFGRYGLEVAPIEYACSYLLTKAIRKDFYNYKLSTLSNYYQINLKHHDALSDAKAAGQIVSNLAAENRFATLDELIRFAGYSQYGLLGSHGFNKANRRKR